MKILFIDVNYKKGSTGKIVADTMDYLKKKDVQTFACYGRGDEIDEINVFKFGIDAETYLHALLTRLTGYTGMFSHFSTKKLISKIEEFKPDIVHLHEAHGYFINYIMLFDYFRKNNTKVVWTQHCCWSFTGHCSYFEFARCYKWKDECLECPNYKEYPTSLFFDKSRQQYKIKKRNFTSIDEKNLIIVSPSIWLDNYIDESFLNKYRHLVINNGINLEKFKATDNNTFDGIVDRTKKIVLAVASDWGDRKGYEDVIDVAQKLSEEYQVVMVGVNDKQFKYLKNTNIVAIKRTNNQVELAELYSMAFVFINPTYEDNFPTVNLEAISCGCPIISYNTGGSIESVTKQNGIIVAQGSVDDLVTTVCSIEKLDFDRQSISKSANLLYNKDVMSEKYYNLYNEVLNDK